MAKIHTINMAPKNTNSVLIESDGLAAIFDPWGAPKKWRELLAERELKLHAIYCTHGHFDHIMGIPDLDAPWYMHHGDLPVIDWSNKVLRTMFSKTIDLNKMPPRPISTGIMEILPGVTVEVLHLPGHSAGGVAFYFDSEKTLIIGDTLFQDCYGRTDIVTGSESQMRESLKQIAAHGFPDDTLVIHGHGPNTTIKYLRENNPYF
ncbi:MAG: MBL fold metallo-hydrolase [Alphaproteobacteria bacterium]|nr:MBL fold metallo-hydrolase [Alphaproteobacteria bacterium]